ncbi:pilus assembly protein [Silicimonas algicola]|uniref:TadE-like protein n=1 Tax=Silicimonas algicola TaxID=1826607 RepID=A0A316G887_9RHOB|nr:TadE family protein [Silicimonas algicola]AZQ67195.1 pilus assembly protein [Silicimonas algicola]PWK56853.1 TadE-like protein [Silicimonas algicola]
MKIRTALIKFRRSEDGVALVEFALLLPVFLLAFFVIVEFTRLFFSYQGAIVGVRDAARYMARTTNGDICADAGSVGVPEVITYNDGDRYYAIVQRSMDTEIDGFLPELVVLDWVSRSVTCVSHADADRYRQARVPMAEVTARFTITFPLVGILELNGQRVLEPLWRDITDLSRVYGV